ncbi:hypothetical protein Barb4_02474 [Bacteroidales bacterium Barb4]|nr:hypothetical protein Barb4_02474 [Bacteroidales bacterium Barb4]
MVIITCMAPVNQTVNTSHRLPKASTLRSTPIYPHPSVGITRFRAKAITNAMPMRRAFIPQNVEPVLPCMVDSTIRLCEVRHIRASMVASRKPSDVVAIKAMEVYSGQKQLVRKMTAVSAGKPIAEKTGDR